MPIVPELPSAACSPRKLRTQALIKSCTRCGQCNAVCPTYLLSGNELDSPRGRILLIQRATEDQPTTSITQQHLDRCISECRQCETACPAEVPYHTILQQGQALLAPKHLRNWGQRTLRWLLRTAFTSPLFRPAFATARQLRPMLPPAIQDWLPAPTHLAPPVWPAAEQQALHTRQIVLLQGCLQDHVRPHIDTATARVLDACGVRTILSKQANCCGAIQAHLGDAAGAKKAMRRNIDIWWPFIQGTANATTHKNLTFTPGVHAEALLISASSCSRMIQSYGQWLADDPQYADKARRVSEWAQDLSQWVPQLLPAMHRRMRIRKHDQLPKLGTITYHPPCSTPSTTHSQPDPIVKLMTQLGFEVKTIPPEAISCCGAGIGYQFLQPHLSRMLRTRLLDELKHSTTPVIVSANLACMLQLQTGTSTPIKHWIELVDEALSLAASN